MDVPEQYRPCKEFSDLYVDREGNFFYRGRQKAVIRSVSRHGKKLTARVFIMLCKMGERSISRLQILWLRLSFLVIMKIPI